MQETRQTDFVSHKTFTRVCLLQSSESCSVTTLTAERLEIYFAVSGLPYVNF
jgi:hypothetical protein